MRACVLCAAMDASLRPPAQSRAAALQVVAAGVVALAVAMGIGRFAFTPLMPLMIRDGTLTAAAGAEWAAANYGGYLVGALTAAWFSGAPRRGMLLSLCGVAVTTLAMAAMGAGTPDLVGAGLRFSSGVFSAWALVCASGWGLALLARSGSASLGSWLYTGVGGGLALAGLFAWLGGRQPAAWLWAELGALACLGVAVAWMLARSDEAAPPAEIEGVAHAPRASDGQWGLVLCYGAFGFAYIIPATFLPAMARELAPDPLVFGLTWPLFGLTAVFSIVVIAVWGADWSRRRVWALSHAAMAFGTAAPVVSKTLTATAASAVLVGGTFMIATMAALQLAREARPDDPTPLIGRMTSAFAAGQIAGPLVVRALGSSRPAGLDALGWSGAAATALLVLTAIWLWRSAGPKSA